MTFPLETPPPGDPIGGVVYLRIILSAEEASRIYDNSVFGKRLSRKSDNVVVFLFAFHIAVQKSYSNTGKENNRRFPPEIIFAFMVPTLYTTSHAPRCYSTVGVSIAVPFSAANWLSAQRSLHPTVPEMYVDSLNLILTAPNFPELTPAIALSLYQPILVTVTYLKECKVFVFHI